MNNKGVAILITFVYLIIVALICATVLLFSHRHYTLISQRYDKFRNMYYVEGGFYMGAEGLAPSSTTFIVDPNAGDIGPGVQSTVGVTTNINATDLDSTCSYQGSYQ